MSNPKLTFVTTDEMVQRLAKAQTLRLISHANGEIRDMPNRSDLLREAVDLWLDNELRAVESSDC